MLRPICADINVLQNLVQSYIAFIKSPSKEEFFTFVRFLSNAERAMF